MVPIKSSVIIPTLNGGAGFEKLLELLSRQQQVEYEIIVIDSGSTDQTLAAAKTCANRLIKIPAASFDHGSTRNYAASFAEGSILVFMTQDALPTGDDTIANLIRPLNDPSVAVSYGRQVPKTGATLAEQYLRLAHYPAQSRIKTAADLPGLGIKTMQCSNACAAYNRELFKQIGGFAEPVICNEDMLYATKAILGGYKIAYTAEAVVQHSHNYNFIMLFKRYFDIAVSLDHQVEIGNLGNISAKGFDYLTGYLAFLKAHNRYDLIAPALVESAFRYLGFKAGLKHTLIPSSLKKRLSLNRAYWEKNMILPTLPVNLEQPARQSATLKGGNVR